MKISLKDLKLVIESYLFEQGDDSAESEPAEEPAEDELPFEEESDEEPSEEEPAEEEPSEEEPAEEPAEDEPKEEESKKEEEEDPQEKLEDALDDKSPREALASIVGKLIAGDKVQLPERIRQALANVSPKELRSDILNDETEYDEDSFTKKYGSVYKFV